MAHSACFHNRFVHVLEPAAAVKLARSASRPAVNSGACVTAICLLFLFGSFWTLSVAHRAQSITRCRMLRLCRKHHGARASILQKHFLQQMLSKLLCHKGNHLSMEMKKLISICDCIISIIATTAVPGFVTVTCNAALRYFWLAWHYSWHVDFKHCYIWSSHTLINQNTCCFTVLFLNMRQRALASHRQAALASHRQSAIALHPQSALTVRNSHSPSDRFNH